MPASGDCAPAATSSPLYHSARAGGADARKFWFDEYRLNAKIGRYPKPYVALMDGIVMGGGVGVAAHGSIRVVTETSKIAMPEVGIGFIPDVGGTYLLSRAPGLLGLHAALTGAPFSGADAIALGFADHYVPHDALEAFTAAVVGDGVEAAVRAYADRATAESACWPNGIGSTSAMPARPSTDIVAALRGHDAGPANDAANLIATRSPIAVSVALRGHAPGRQARHTGRRTAPGVPDIVRGAAQSTTSSRASAPRSSTRTATRSGRPPSLAAVTEQDVEDYFAPGRPRPDLRGGQVSYETILVDREERVGIITLNRPQALNALNSQVMNEVTTAAAEFDADPGIGAIIITGNAKAFAAGADIKEMATLSFSEVFDADFFAAWGKLAAVRTPTIAAVAGYALGGGCELAMMCDVLIAADTAKFGQPEIKLGVLPGMGGSQRLTRAIGKAKAMDLILTGRTIDAAEAERSGLVSRVVPGRRSAHRGQGRRHDDLADVAVGGADGQGGRQPRLRVHARPRDCSTSAGCSTPPSPPTTRPRGWPPSARSALPTSRTDKVQRRERQSNSDDRPDAARSRRSASPTGGSAATPSPAPRSAWCSCGCR